MSEAGEDEKIKLIKCFSENLTELLIESVKAGADKRNGTELCITEMFEETVKVYAREMAPILKLWYDDRIRKKAN